MAQGSTPPDRVAAEAGEALRQEARFSVALLRRHGWRLALVFIGLLLPLWGFGELADEIHEGEAIRFDEPLLLFAQQLAGAGLDRAFLFVSDVGCLHGVVPFDVALVLLLALRRHFREATFAAFALGGSGLLNLAVKHLFARERPTLWESIAPEATFSFPSGHAMGSATLASVLILLEWRTRWRWPVRVAMVAFTLAVGLSRIYLGVHYPSDILAGWTAAGAWTAAVFLVVFRGKRGPWHGRAER
jgi:membrane-associated phospholipid phosphatase